MPNSEDVRLTPGQIGEALSMRPELVTDKVAIVAITDLDGTITYANDLFVEVSGYSRRELIGANHRILNSGLVVSRHWWKFSGGVLRASGFGPDQAARSRLIGAMG